MPPILKRVSRVLLLSVAALGGLLAAVGVASVIYLLRYGQTGGPILLQLDMGTPVAAAAVTPTPNAPAIPLPGEGIMYDTGTKIVNLADPGGRRYLKVAIVLEFVPHDVAYYTLPKDQRTAAQNAFNQEMALKKPLIDDTLTTLLSAKTYEQVYSLEGKNELKQEILQQLGTILRGERIVNVYFTDFVIQ